MSSEFMVFIGLIIGILAYVLLYLGKGIQKYAIEGLKIDKSIKSKHTGTWVFGTVLTTTYFFVQWAALFFAPINIIAPLGGIGLLVLILFSYYVLHEEIHKIQIIGIIFIIIGTTIVNIFNPNTGEIYAEDFNLSLMLTFSLPIIIIEVIAVIISKLKDYVAAGLIIGTTAGTFNALQTVSKRITAIPDPVLTIVFILITFLTAVLTLIFTQYAFTKAKANIAIPCYTSASISLAVIISLIALNEKIDIIQVIGIIVIIFGVIFVSAFRKEIKREG